ncbi:hypothetical protein WAI453_005517 [Rhynchosporium graminicola]
MPSKPLTTILSLLSSPLLSFSKSSISSPSSHLISSPPFILKRSQTGSPPSVQRRALPPPATSSPRSASPSHFSPQPRTPNSTHPHPPHPAPPREKKRICFRRITTSINISTHGTI